MLLALKLKAALIAACVASPIAVSAFDPAGGDERQPVLGPPVVAVPAGSFHYRLSGDFSRGGKSANAPLQLTRLDRVVDVMTRQVTGAEYQACVDEGGCPALAGSDAAPVDRPVVGVSWRDAEAYAVWLSRKTGARYRLPTDEEWAYVAGSRHADDVVPETDPDNPAKRWLARYEQESSRERSVDREPRPIGSFGANEHGLLDLSGNVWEWTSTCFTRYSLDAADRFTSEPVVNCGVRVVEGRHRTYVTDFVRDARAGGCAVGTPPSNLGFRLVRDDESAPGLVAGVRRIIGRLM